MLKENLDTVKHVVGGQSDRKGCVDMPAGLGLPRLFIPSGPFVYDMTNVNISERISLYCNNLPNMPENVKVEI